jgi:hypothetical protein
MRTILILFLAVLIAGCGASNVQVIKPVNGDVKPLLRPELQKGQCFNFTAGGGGGETLTKKSGMSSDECNLTVDEVVYRLTVLACIGKETYTAEAGERHVIAKRAKGNKDVEVTAKYYYELEGGVRGIEVLINDFTDPNYDKAAAPGWVVKAIYREVIVKDGKLTVVKEGMSREEFFEQDRIEHYKMLNRMMQEKK